VIDPREMSKPATRVSIVLKRSSWQKWVEEEKDAHIFALLRADDETVRRMRASHLDHLATVEEVRMALEDLGIDASWHDRPHEFRIEGRCDLVVTVGGDGTLLAASHGIGAGIPLLGVNSAPDHSVGFFCGAAKGEARQALEAALSGSLPRSELTRMRVDLNGRRLLDRVLNEALFCHASPAATSRYILRLLDRDGRERREEEQKSSGVWIGPAAGSTAAQHSAGGNVLPLESQEIQYVVREPYRPDGESLHMTGGLVEPGEVLVLRSKMRRACLFLDGDYIAHDVTIGDIVAMSRSDEPLAVLGLGAGRSGSGRARGSGTLAASLSRAIGDEQHDHD
jgi:NAD+ kinase